MNENKIINRIREKFFSQGVDLTDDVAFLRQNGKTLVLKTDMFIESTDLPPGMTLRQAARKAIIACISDLACKGATMTGFMVSLGIPRSYSYKQKIDQIIEGLYDASLEYNVPLIGGDVNESKELVIDCAMVGEALCSVTRGGANVNDILATTGPFGYAALGLKHLLGNVSVSGRLKKEIVDSVCNPRPKVELCIKLVNAGVVNASMDSSDGLAITLNEIAKRSKKKLVVTTLPADDLFILQCKAMRFDEAELCFYGGEEYEAVFSISKKKWQMAATIAKDLGGKLYPLGFVTKGRPIVLYKPNPNAVSRRIDPKGWIHLT